MGSSPAAMVWGGKQEGRSPSTRNELHGIAGLAMDLSPNRYSNTTALRGGMSQQALIPTWRYGTMPDGSTGGERPSASLRRLIDDIASGRMETTDYPSSKKLTVN